MDGVDLIGAAGGVELLGPVGGADLVGAIGGVDMVGWVGIGWNGECDALAGRVAGSGGRWTGGVTDGGGSNLIDVSPSATRLAAFLAAFFAGSALVAGSAFFGASALFAGPAGGVGGVARGLVRCAGGIAFPALAGPAGVVLTGSVVVVLVGSAFGGLPLFLTVLAGAFLPGVFVGSADAFLPGVFAGSADAFLPGVFAGSADAFLPGVFAGSDGAFLPGDFAGRGGAVCPDAVVAAAGDVVAGSGAAFLAGALVGSGRACLAGAGSDDAAALVRLRGRRGVCSSPIRTRVVRVSPSHRARSAGKTTKILLSPV